MVKYSEARLEALFTIIDHRLEEALINVYKSNNMPILLLTHGRGTAKSVVYEIIGYEALKKTVSISIQTKKKTKHILKQLNNHIDFSKPSTGIAFTINISSISSALYNICLKADGNLMIGSEDMALTLKEPYHLIVTIVNSGFFDQVMSAAKKAG